MHNLLIYFVSIFLSVELRLSTLRKARPGFFRPIQFVSAALQKSYQPMQSQTDLLGRTAEKKGFITFAILKVEQREP